MKTVHSYSAEDNSRSKPQAKIDGREKALLDDSAGTTAVSSLKKQSRPSSSEGAAGVVGVEFGSTWDEESTFAHILQIGYLEHKLNVDVRNGLSEEDAAFRLQRDGANKIRGTEGTSMWRILLRQVSNSLTLVLTIAMALSYGINDYIEGSVITAVIFLNIVIGFFQDYRAEETMQSLKALSAPICKVIRNSGIVKNLKTEELVVGDIVQLSTGDIIPADLRLFQGFNLETNEALLTGESLPIIKTPFATLEVKDLPIGERTNMAYSASIVTKGRGQGLVIGAGNKTEVGRIADLLSDAPAKDTSSSQLVRILNSVKHGIKNTLGLVGTPLQIKLSWFALLLLALAILLALIVFSANKWNVSGEVLLYGVCVAVAVIPESLIAVLTITMAVGTKAMARGNVIVRKLQAIEAVGGVTNVCSDKTGTLTQGKMSVRTAWIPGAGTWSVHETEELLDPMSGIVKLDDATINAFTAVKPLKLITFLNAISLCNLSNVYQPKSTELCEKPTMDYQWKAVGDPTEVALQVFAMRFDHGRETLLLPRNLILLAEHPFDSSIKRMSVVYENTTTQIKEVFSKGAFEAMAPILSDATDQIATIGTMAESMAANGLRVLCIAHKILTDSELESIASREVTEHNLRFLGLIGVYDPPRPGTLDSVQKCHRAGITVHMLTGDHISTATAVARDVGIIEHSVSASPGITTVMTAGAFDALSDIEIDALISLPLVIARCSPTTKVRMVNALHRRKAFCIMTGDGVNDSPALKRADVGIAMGLNGSDVAKDCADMILTDDDFSSIIRAISEGRRLFDNIQKFLLHLLISNISQVVLLLLGLAFSDSNGRSVFPLSPLEILWVNMITSSFLALGLGMEASSLDLMLRPPRNLSVGVFTRELIVDKMIYGVTMGALCLAAFVSVVYGKGEGDLGHDCNQGYNDSCYTVYRARATVFSVLSFLLLVTAWEVKHFTRSLFNMIPEKRTGVTSVWYAVRENGFLWWAVVGGFVITFPVVYIPIVNRVVFKHLGIGWEWGVVIGCVVCYLAVVESWKAVKRKCGIGSVVIVKAGVGDEVV